MTNYSFDAAVPMANYCNASATISFLTYSSSYPGRWLSVFGFWDSV